MRKTYYVERIIMCGGGNSYNVYENGSWNTHSSQSTIEINGRNKTVYRIDSLRVKDIENLKPLSDERSRIVKAHYDRLDILAKSLCQEAFPETQALKDPLSLWHHFEEDLSAKIVKIVIDIQ